MDTFEQLTQSDSLSPAASSPVSNPLSVPVGQHHTPSALETRSSEVEIYLPDGSSALPVETFSHTVIPAQLAQSNHEEVDENLLTGKADDEPLVGSPESLDLGTVQTKEAVDQILDASTSSQLTELSSVQPELAPASDPTVNSALIQPTFIGNVTVDGIEYELTPHDLPLEPVESSKVAAIENSSAEAPEVGQQVMTMTGMTPTAMLAQPINPATEILTVPGANGSVVPLTFRWTERDALFNNEVGVFVVDDLGRVDGIAPDHPDYARAALASPFKQVIFSSGQGAGAQKQLQFTANEKLAFYLIQNNTSDQWLQQNPGNQVGQGPIAFFSLNQANPDQFDHLQSRLLSNGVVELRWEDLTGGGDRDFDDVVFTIAEPGGTTPGEGPALIVPGLSGQQVGTKFVWVFREAAFNNEMGVFFVDDAQGRIGNLLPGDPGYALAALTRQGSQIIFSSGETAGTTEEVELPSQKYIGFYLIQNSTTATFLQQNPQNQIGKGPLAFFFFPEANPDGIVHIQQRSNNEIGWEDLTGGGDRDFDDLIFRYEFGTPTGGSLPQLSISDVSVVEGDTGTKTAQFAVSLSQASTQPITVKFSTEGGTATSGIDFQPVSGTLTFAPGETTQIIAVPVVGDTSEEVDETFTANLDTPTNATLADALGVATIVNDDQGQVLDVVLQEGTSFQATYRQSFTVPQEPSILKFSFADLVFDTIDPDSINDAFEARLVDANGKSIVYTLGKGQDTFFNITEGLTAQLAPGVTLEGQTVSINLAGLTSGSAANLILQLVNNDGDTTTSVRITNFEITPADTATPLIGVVPTISAGNNTPFSVLLPEEFAALQLQDVSASFTADYGRTSFNEATKILYTDLAVRNSGTYAVDTPLYMVVERLSDPSVQVLNADGITPDGLPYYDVSRLVADGNLAPGEASAAKTIAFYNPNSVQFDYQLTFLGQLDQAVLTNQAPQFTSSAVVNAFVGQPYSYNAEATDPDNDALTYSLKAGPQGMQVDAATGTVTWTPTTTDLGSQSVTLLVEDGKGGKAEQTFSIVTAGTGQSTGNNAPVITSSPIVSGFTTQPYTYDVDAIDADNDPLTYSLVSAPQGMTIDPTSGLISWNPTNPLAGTYAVQVSAEDGKGGSNIQSFDIALSNIIPGEIRGTVWDDLNANSVRDSDLIQGANPDIVFIADVSFSADDPFQGSPVGDLNNDGRANTILDAEIAGFIALNQQLIRQGLGQTAEVSVMSFALSGTLQDMNPNVSGRQIVTNPAADNDQDGILDVEEALRSLRTGPFTNFEAALQRAEEVFRTLGTQPGDGNVVFLSDGVNTIGGDITGELANLRALGVNLSAFGVGAGAALNDGDRLADDLELIDPNATIFTSTDELLNVFSGLGGGQNIIEPGLPGVRVYLDANNNGVLDQGELSLLTSNDDLSTPTVNEAGQYAFTGLQPGSYTVRQIVPDGYRQTFPGRAGTSQGDGYADVVLEYFAAGNAPSALKEPYGSNGGIPAFQDRLSPFYTVETVSPNAVLGAPPAPPVIGQNPLVDWLALPQGSFVTVGFLDETVIDGPGDDIFIRSFDPEDSANERADVYVSSNGNDFVFLGQINEIGLQPLDLADIGFADPVRAVRIVGVDNLGTSPGFDLISVEVLPNSIGPAPDFYTVDLGAGEIVDNRNFGNTLSSGGTNQAPTFTSIAPTVAQAGVLLRYDAKAIDPNGDALTFDLLTKPTGMAIDPTRGVIIWNPTPEQIGTQDVVLRVQDGRGGSALQSFQITVGANQAPQITSAPVNFARINTAYQYQVTATDPEGQNLTYSLQNAPTGLAIDAATGLLQWTPTLDQAGTYPITITVQDEAGAIGRQSFTLTAGENASPVINSTAPTTITAGLTYRYDVNAVDPDGNILNYTLVNAPQDMVIDNLGRLSWTTTTANLGTAPIQIVVTDADGASTAQTFDLTVAPDVQAPKVNVQLSSGTIEIGKTVSFQLSATDNVKVNPEDVTLTVNGNPIALAGGKNGMFQPTQAGLYEVIATVKDAAGNLTTTNPITLRVVDPKDTNAPEITITSPSTNAQVTTLTDVLGSVIDTDLEFYRVDYAPLSQVDFNNLRLADPDFVTITQQSTTVTNGTLAQFDPTLLQNDNYVIRVTAQDVNGNINTQGIILGVNGDNKLGNFRLELTDLSLPLGGIPITVNRVYDTLQRNQTSDFGFGWSLGVQDARIQESVPINPGEDFGLVSLFTANSFKAGDRVTLTTPDGRRVGFTFDPVIASNSFFGPLWKPQFTADAGVFDTLADANDSIRLVRAADGSFRFPLFSFAYNPTDYKLTTKDGLTYRYDQFEGLEEIRDRNGNFVTFTDAGITSSTGASVQFARDPQGRITQILDPKGQAIQYSYDAKGDLVKVTDSVGLSTLHSYVNNQPHYLERITDPRGKDVIKTEYDEWGRVKATTDALGRSLNVSYELSATTSTETNIDPLGNSTTTVRDARGNILSVTNPIGAVRSFTYDENNNQISETDPRGFTINRTYDAQGNITSIVEPLGVTNSFTYDQFNNVTTATDALGRTLTYVYDDRGNLKELIDPAGGKGQFTVDELGRITSLTDPKGNKTTYVYDRTFSASVDLDKPTQIIFADGSVKKFEYNQFGQVQKAIDENGHVTEFITDSIGRLLIQRDHLGNETTYAYDAQNLIGVTDPLGNTTRFEYDDSGQITRRIDPAGGITTYSYDALGRLVSETDPLGRTTTRSYCTCGSLSSVTDAIGNVVSFEYDLAGNLIGIVDPLGQKTNFVYDALGRQTQQVDPLGNEKSFVYDAADNLIETIDRNGRVRRFSYDQLDQLTQETWWNNNAVSRQINLEYDAAGNLIAVQDGESNHTFTYDNRNRVTQTNNTIASGIIPSVLNYTYDKVGQVISVEDNLGTKTESIYDPLNRLISQTWQGTEIDAVRVDMAYNAGGDLIQINRFSDLAGTQLVSKTTQAYDPIQLDSTLKARSYNARGDREQIQEFLTLLNPRSLNVENTSDTALQTDDDYLKRITQISNTDALGNIISSYSSDYDLVGQLIQESYNDQTKEYVYDLNGQLTQANYSDLPNEIYIYDANGNRISSGYIIGSNNQVLSDGVFNYTYDAEGNLTNKTHIATNETTEYSYNHRNQLITVITQNANGQIIQDIEYAYDAFDRRIAENLNGQTTYFTYNNENPWSDLDELSNVIAQYLSEDRIDGLLARYRPDEGTAWYLKDRLGTVRDIVDSEGQLLNHLEYSSFGQILSQTNASAGDRFGFTGREYSNETGLYYYRARYYDPNLGRFINQDPIGFEAGDSNLYRYVGNSSLNAIDPTGLVSMSEYRALVSTIVQTVQKCIARTVGASIIQNTLEAGVYLFLTQDGKWYVGQTNNFDRRFGEHKAKQFVSETIQKIQFPAKDKDALRKVEQYLYDVVESAFGSQDKLNKVRPLSPKKPKLDC